VPFSYSNIVGGSIVNRGGEDIFYIAIPADSAVHIAFDSPFLTRP
jgi:hypothetical protein